MYRVVCLFRMFCVLRCVVCVCGACPWCVLVCGVACTVVCAWWWICHVHGLCGVWRVCRVCVVYVCGVRHVHGVRSVWWVWFCVCVLVFAPQTPRSHVGKEVKKVSMILTFGTKTMFSSPSTSNVHFPTAFFARSSFSRTPIPLFHKMPHSSLCHEG